MVLHHRLVGSPSQSPTTVTVPSSLASSSACAACMDTPSAMATARRDNELTDDIEAPQGRRKSGAQNYGKS